MLKKRVNRLLVVFALMLVGCGAGGDTGSGVSLQLLGPTTPQDVVRDFLSAWDAQNYAAMYNLLSPQSQEAHAADEFVVTYEDVHAVLALNSVSFTIRNAQVQGGSAAVRYDATLESGVFGSIEDTERMMRLVQSPAGWRVAWSTMDIFDTLAAGARLVVDAQPQPRANIYDRNGNLLVEQGGTVVTLYAIRDDIFNEVDCANLLATIFLKQPDEFLSTFADYNFDTLFYVGEVDPETAARYNTGLEELCGIFNQVPYRYERQTRRYVGHGAASHITGYVGQMPAEQVDVYLSRGYRQGDLVGLAGIEGAYQDELAGRAAQILRVVEPGGVTLMELAGAEGSPPSDVTLTIDRDLQLATAQAISDAYNYAQINWGSLSPGTSAVVMDVNTGAVLAMASYPTFEPAIFNPDTPYPFVGDYIVDLFADPNRPLTNRAVQEQYSPGSVFKIVTTSAVAAENVFEPDEIFECGLTWDGAAFGDTFGIRTDWRVIDGMPATGPITMSQALTSSCDPFYYQMGALLYQREPGLLMEYARRMGFGRTSGLGLPGAEASGQLPIPSSAAEAINTAIGQGDVQTTVIQNAKMVVAVANGGTVYTPYIVERVGGQQVGEPTVEGEIGVSQEVLDIVRQGMCDVTTLDGYGTAVWVFAETPMSVCGKTGTAQTARPEPNAWFVAYAPADNPQIAVAVMSEHSREGSEVAGPIARRILESYFGVPYYPYPEWWNNLEYIPLVIPEGATGG